MLKQFAAIAGAALLLVTPPALAQSPDPAAVAAAREMLSAQNFLAQMRASAERTSEATFETITRDFETRNGAAIPEELREEVHLILREHVNDAIARMEDTALDEAARVYARYFTADEIRELHGLLSHPVMARFQTIGPQFMAELTQIGIRASVAGMPALRERINAAIADWLARNPERLRPVAT